MEGTTSRIEEIDEDEVSSREEVPAQARRSARRIPFLPNTTFGRRRGPGLSYTEKYPPGEVGGEMGPNARVWRVYLDEADEFDAEMMESFKDTTDVLLVFAGLFSAVVTTFVSQASQALEPDYALVTAALMTELVSLQRAVATGTPISDIPPSPITFANTNTTTSFDIWVNGLWFTSLALSLVAALTAVLVKQWLQYYISALSGSPRDRVLVRHFRFMGLEKWAVSGIIGMLPVLLHVAVFMFLIGLVVFVWELNLAMAAVILSLAITGLMFYLMSNILASFIPNCPYKTPVAELLLYLRQLVLAGYRRVHGRLVYIKSRKEYELYASNTSADSTLPESLFWLSSTSSDPSAHLVACDAFAGVPFHLQVPPVPGDIWYTNFMRVAEWKDSSFLETAPIDEIEANLLANFTSSTSALPSFNYDAFFPLFSQSPIIRCVLALSVEPHTLPPPLNRFDLLVDLIANDASLPPWLWKVLFERPALPVVDATKLLVLLLGVFRNAQVDRITAISSHSNRDLPPLITLAELCKRELRMYNIILHASCRWLLHGSYADALEARLARAQAGDAEKTSEVVLFAHAVLDQLEPGTHDDINTEINATAVERSLLSIRTYFWTSPEFVHAWHRCITLLHTCGGSSVHPAVSNDSPVPNSIGLIMTFILGILEHPWPLIRTPYIKHTDEFYLLVSATFSRRDSAVFTTFLESNGLQIFRTYIPIDFYRFKMEIGFTDHVTSLRHNLFCYLDFVANLPESDRRRHAHLGTINQPDNLAWLVWLTISQSSYHLSYSVNRVSDIISMRGLFQALLIDPHCRRAAVDILIEEVRRDCASHGPLQNSSIYDQLYSGLYALGLADGQTLYGYVSPASMSPFFFKRFDEGEDVQYGPLPVYYEAPFVSGKRERANTAKRWYQQLLRLQP